MTPAVSQMASALASTDPPVVPHQHQHQHQQKPVCTPPSPPALCPPATIVGAHRPGLGRRLSDWWWSKPAPAPASTAAPSNQPRLRPRAANSTASLPPRPLSAAAILHWTQDRDLAAMGGQIKHMPRCRPPIPVFDPPSTPAPEILNGPELGRKRRSVHEDELWSTQDGPGQASPPSPAPLDGSPRRALAAHPQVPGDRPRLRHPVSRKAPRPASYDPSVLAGLNDHRKSTPALAEAAPCDVYGGHRSGTFPRLRQQRTGSRNDLWRASVVLCDHELEPPLLMDGDGSAIEVLGDLPASPPPEPLPDRVRLASATPPPTPHSVGASSRTDQSRIHALLSSRAADPVLSSQEAVALRNSSCLLPMHVRKYKSVEVLRATLANWPPETPLAAQDSHATLESATSLAEDETKAQPRTIEGRQSRPTPPSLVLSSPTSTDPRPLILEGAEFEPLSVPHSPSRRASFFSLGFGLGSPSPSRGRSASVRAAPASPRRPHSTRGSRRARTPLAPDAPWPRDNPIHPRSTKTQIQARSHDLCQGPAGFGHSKTKTNKSSGCANQTDLSSAAAGVLASTRIGGAGAGAGAVAGALAPTAVLARGPHSPRPPRGVGVRRPKSPALPTRTTTLIHGAAVSPSVT